MIVEDDSRMLVTFPYEDDSRMLVTFPYEDDSRRGANVHIN